jgi:hypothetical protein
MTAEIALSSFPLSLTVFRLSTTEKESERNGVHRHAHVHFPRSGERQKREREREKERASDDVIVLKPPPSAITTLEYYSP